MNMIYLVLLAMAKLQGFGLYPEPDYDYGIMGRLDGLWNCKIL